MKKKQTGLFLVLTVATLLAGIYTLYIGYSCLNTVNGLWEAIKALPEQQSDAGLYLVCGILAISLGILGLIGRKPHKMSFPIGQLALIMCGINVFYNGSGRRVMDIGLVLLCGLYTLASYPTEQERRKQREREEKMMGKNLNLREGSRIWRK